MRSDRNLLRELRDALAVFDEIRLIETTDYHDLIEDIRTRLAEPENEPVCWFNEDDLEMAFEWNEDMDHTIPLYRHPPRQSVRLSDAEIAILRHGVLYREIGYVSPGIFTSIANIVMDAMLEKNK